MCAHHLAAAQRARASRLSSPGVGHLPGRRRPQGKVAQESLAGNACLFHRPSVIFFTQTGFLKPVSPDFFGMLSLILISGSASTAYEAGEVLSHHAGMLDTIPYAKAPSNLGHLIGGGANPLVKTGIGELRSWRCDDESSYAAILFPLYSSDITSSVDLMGDSVPRFCVPIFEQTHQASVTNGGASIIIGYTYQKLEAFLLSAYYSIGAPSRLIQYLIDDAFYMWT